MADEPRRSGRATKGQHTKNTESADAPPSKRQKGKGKAAKAPSTEPADEEDDAIIRCVCGFQEDNGGRTMIACDNCDVWQHNDCMGLPEDEEDQPDKYYCEQCRPEDHKELLDGMARGEKPWEARQRAAAELRKQKKKKKPKGRGQGKLARPSDAGSQHEAHSSSPKPQQSTPTAVKQETGIKRKREDGVGQNGQTDQNTETQPPAGVVSPVPSTKAKRSSLPNIGVRRQSAPRGPDDRRDSTGPVYAESIDDLAPERKRPAKVIQDDLAGLIRQAAQQGSYRIPDGETAASLSNRLGLHIEHALFVHFGGTSNGYADQFRAIRFNIKRNVDLLNGLLQKTLSPEQLAAMSSEDMVDEETRRQNAAIKEAADKQAILIHEEGPRIRKTHKGEELIGEDTMRRENEQTFTAPPIRHRETAEDTEMRTADTPPAEVGSPTMVELPEDVGTRQPLTVDTSAASPPAPPHRQSTAGFDINQVWSSVQSPETDQQRLLQRPPRRRSSVMKQQPIQGPGDDAEIDRLLKDEDDDVPMYSPVTQEAASTNIWRGKLGMQGIGQCHGTARHVAGGAVHNKFSYSALLGHDLDISGRIAVERADEYVSGMRVSLTTDVTVLSLIPSDNDNDRAAFQNIFNYFHAKQRWGVIAKFPHEAVRDVYVVPLEAGIAKLPSFLEDLEYNVIENVRPDNMLLITMVVRHKSPVPSAQATPQHASDMPAQVAPSGPPAAPVQSMNHNPVGQPQFSPVAPHSGSNPMSSTMNNGPGQPSAYGFIPSPYNAPLPFSPPTTANQMAAQVLGPFISAPVVGQMLNMVQDITEQQLRNLRDILENEPATRNDLNMLASHLMQKNSQQK